MPTILTLVLIWFAISIPVALLAGSFFALSNPPKETKSARSEATPDVDTTSDYPAKTSAVQ